MTPVDVPGAILKIAYAVAASAILGGGAVVINTAQDVAVLQKQQEQNERRLERIEHNTDRILEKLAHAPGK